MGFFQRVGEEIRANEVKREFDQKMNYLYLKSQFLEDKIIRECLEKARNEGVNIRWYNGEIERNGDEVWDTVNITYSEGLVDYSQLTRRYSKEVDPLIRKMKACHRLASRLEKKFIIEHPETEFSQYICDMPLEE